MPDISAAIKAKIREIPDFPRPGILFRDISPLLLDHAATAKVIATIVARYVDHQVDVVFGAESRGFIFGMPVAYQMGAGFHFVRKPGKLPHETIGVEYDLEYGTDRLEVHKDSVKPGQRVLLVDDLLATGGTARACVDLVERLGGVVVACVFVIELAALGGRKKLKGHEIHSLAIYD